METKSYLQAVETYMRQAPWPKGFETLYEPCQYIMQIGGKRVRPVSLCMAYSAFQPDYKAAMPAAMAMEVFHNFTLMHDDIMDEASLRRNQPTVHIKYNNNTAILSGDVMLIHAYDLLLRCCDKKTQGPVLQTFSDVARGVCEGQRLDMDFETTDSVSLSQYITMISLKTAVLLAGCLKIGALLAGAKKRDAQLLYTFGLDAGIAFQILDDYLDAFADQADFGKTVGGDIVQGKKTFLVLKALQVLKGREKQAFVTLFASKTMPQEAKIHAVKAIFVQHGIDQMAKDAAANYTRKAELALEHVSASRERKAPLYELMESLLGRRS
jgi:geranylgeranyl diphosphate synthase, type II